MLKVYVDADDRLAQDWTATLGENKYAGHVEIRDQWKEGYQQMSAADASKVKK